ncbi:pyridoxal kinase PdxY [Apibacter muscae]|uniref:pyridoxal kinase PdxY n=1 Tax=Apibacter muscae TaxID=2509004 RepID=UPI0011AC77EA|nr:pyridoxal kinase PdxY [Apibacter muscae]TWP22829.1 pyridoxal kinase PdxY [Apibacter muscae]
MKNILSIQSHVVFGHAGNSAAEFPMQRCGVGVWSLNTVQFSNHTQYGKWTGEVMPALHLLEIVEGIDNIQQLNKCDAILNGYIGSPEQGKAILEIVKKIKSINPNAVYFCDPVMGHPEKGCIVAEGVSDFFKNEAIQASDIMSPNLLELEILTGKTMNHMDDVLQGTKILHQKGVNIVLVKHLSKAAKSLDQFEMILSTKDEVWHIARPLFDFGTRQPVGVGDLTSGLLLTHLLLGKNGKEALEATTAAVYAVMLETYKRGEYELQLVAAQEEIANPSQHFEAIKI